MEAYLYYLLKNGKVLEFFFEGGRSRSGKLLPPRFGLFKMILDAYKELSKEVNKKLLFIPVAVLNEYVLEQKSLNLEIKGGKKKKESTKQLFSLFKIFSRKLGSIHLIFGKPVDSKDCKGTDLRTQSQDIAFQCFRTIGKNMKVTPSSLLSLVLLEEHEGVMKWTDIMLKARSVRWFCLEFNIPIIKSLQNEDEFEGVLGKAIDIMIANKKVRVIGRNQNTIIYYSIYPEARSEVLYFKNTILHHFLVPWILNNVWGNIFNGTITTEEQLKTFFLSQRDQLKHEFYLPTVRRLFYRSLEITSYCIGREISSLKECLNLNYQELYLIASRLSFFSKVGTHIHEAYYVALLTIKSFDSQFTEDEYLKKVKKTFEWELDYGRIVKYKECYSIPIFLSSLKSFTQLGLIEFDNGYWKIIDDNKVKGILEMYEKIL